MSGKPLRQFTDIHHHGSIAPELAHTTIVCLSPYECTEVPAEGFYSVGIHPWDTARFTPEIFATLEKMAAAPNVVAIGEAGLDALTGAPLPTQTEIFKLQAALAEKTEKPLIIHAVRTFNQIFDLHRTLRPTQQWIIHGFRGKPQLAQQLLRQGIALSFGNKYNPQSLSETPPHMLYRESDTDAAMHD